jgi:1-acyl-sn-glycerol-3-phosphate acyltransferase
VISATLRWIVCATSALVAVLVGWPLALFAPVLFWRATRRFAWLQLRILGVRLTVEDRNDGRYEDPPYVFVGLNQTSLLDGFLMGAVLPIPVRGIYNAAWAILPPFGWMSLLLGGVVVFRGWPAQRRWALRRAQRQMQAGHDFALSIEGRRFGLRDADGLLPYRTGAARLAISVGARIVPFVVRGSAERLPLGSFRVRPGSVTATILEPVSTEGLSLDDRKALTERLRVLAVRELTVSTT